MYYLDTPTKHPLMAQAMLLAKNAVALSSQKSYQSSWNKWEKFLLKYFSPVWTTENYSTID